MRIIALALAATLAAGQPAPVATTGQAAPVATAGQAAPVAADVRLTLPAPTGHDRIGTVSLHLVDASRGDPWVPAEKRRELMAQIWYPAATVDGYRRADWVTPGIAAKLAPPGSGFTVPVTDGHIGAPAAPGRRPVVLFSPGLGMERTTATALVEDLASHGFVVVTIDHTHDANFVEFPDGRIATLALPVPTDETQEKAMLAKALAVRVADTRFVLDTLTAIARGRGPSVPRGLPRALDLNRVAMVGHSMGGATAAETMRVDRRVRAGLNLDGTFFGRVLDTGLDRPFLMLGAATGDDGTWTRMWTKLRGPRHWLELQNTRHLSFTDLQTLLPQMNTPAEQAEPLIGTIDGDRSIAVQRPYVRAFLDRYLRHRPGTLLTGPSPAYPEMRFPH
ncbi:hydrolase [Actinoplanes bogorensis]|uniref:Hydrolase n=1 Tax=Paractinoplanes bogorensis TaxID=1610840 RepID=A0ABS5Z5Z1_9ACTN|nr:hydrolase [Actinoplanes bogorensis]MBU2670791.1 hydrolase [Actinoplanes bogorensis]